MKYTIFSVLLAAAALTSVPAFADYNQALELFKQAKYQESLTAVAGSLDVAKDNDPASENYQLRFLAAHNHRKLGNTVSAAAHFQKCAEIKPGASEPLIELSFIMIDTGKYKESIAFARKVISLDAKNATGYYLLGLSLYKQGAYWGAKESLEKALALDPEMYTAWNTQGLVLMALKKYPDANTAFSAALAMNPGTAEILNNLAVSYAKLGKTAEAQKAAEKAASLAPANEQIKKNKDSISQMKKS
ncbi:MAG: tetratricopeptide repeat protein [Spirochaetota bacterium]